MSAIDEHARTRHKARFMRADAWRYRRPRAEHVSSPSITSDDARTEFIADLASIRRDLAALRLGLAAIVARKYDPDQPRLPAGQSGGGQWTDESGDGVGESSAGRSTLYVAGAPRIPGQRPPSTSARNAIFRAVAAWLAENGTTAASYLAKSSWLYKGFAYINAYLDAPKSLAELHEAVSNKAAGYDAHHIVEQTAAERDGYPRALIDREDNLVRIPKLKHWEIDAWFQTRSDEFGGLSPREYPRYKNWDERRNVGLRALINVGVLRP